MISKLREAGASRVLVRGPKWYMADKYLRDVVMPPS